MEVRELRFRNASNVPRLGDPRRVPSYAYVNWGLPLGSNRHESDELYRSEWEGGSPKQMQVVVDAITQSGLGNFSQMLRDINARAVAHIAERSQTRVRYLEPGAGVSTINVYQTLLRKGLDLQKIQATLVEPSRERLGATVDALKRMDLKEGKDFIAFQCRDVDMLSFIQPASQDIVSLVATLHHHAYIDTPLSIFYRILANSGLIMIADWHNSMWEHPARVYQALREDYDWPSKEEDLARFLAIYPNATERPWSDDFDFEANRMIREFWRSYGKIKAQEIADGQFKEEDDILMLEGHRPVEQYLKELDAAGFLLSSRIPELIEALKLNGSPHQLLPDSSILMFTLASK